MIFLRFSYDFPVILPFSNGFSTWPWPCPPLAAPTRGEEPGERLAQPGPPPRGRAAGLAPRGRGLGAGGSGGPGGGNNGNGGEAGHCTLGILGDVEKHGEKLWDNGTTIGKL